MKHIVYVGNQSACWSDRTGELVGDPEIIDAAKAIEVVLGHIEWGPQPVSWAPGSVTATPALVEGARSVFWAQPKLFAIPEAGDPDDGSAGVLSNDYDHLPGPDEPTEVDLSCEVVDPVLLEALTRSGDQRAIDFLAFVNAA
jgi:hypothetical protein